MKPLSQLLEEIDAVIPWDYPERDAIAELRLRAVRMESALGLIAGERCSTYFSRPGDANRWQCPGSGRKRVSTTGTADQWCDACIAHEALS